MPNSLLKQLVTGEDACTAGAGPSGSRNAVGALSDALFGGSARLTEQTGRMADAPSTSHSGAVPMNVLRERAMAHAGVGDNALVDEFLKGGPDPGVSNEMEMFEQIYAKQEYHHRQNMNEVIQSAQRISAFPRGEHDVVVEDACRGFLHQRAPFAGNGVATAPLRPMSVTEQCHVRDRSTILARQLFSDRGDAFVNQHVDGLLRSLHIDPRGLPREASGHQMWDGLWTKTTVAMDHAAGVSSHNESRLHGAGAQPVQWVDEFVEAVGDKHVSWADEFERDKNNQQHRMAGVDRDAAVSSVSAIEHTRRLADALSAETDPKFKNSQFLQFVSKMSRGELIVDGNDVREVDPVDARQRQMGTSTSFVEEYLDTKAGEGDWAEQFAGVLARDVAPSAPSNVPDNVETWVNDFVGRADSRAWANEFAAFENGFVTAGGYRMAPNNPFMMDMESFSKGRQLFQQGLLTESVLAIEAECQRRPDNVDAWTLLGKVQAENDDDVQAIEAMKRALASDPNNLEVLLSLGVSYTNEFDRKNAVEYLRRWLATHPRHGASMREIMMPPDSSQELSHTIYLYKKAAQQSPNDADVHAALGVLCNLARQYDDAVTAFRQALHINGKDYSLWNKLGATLANSSRSGEALDAYRRALESKPNYMRGWINMGISLANLGKYEESARYYVRALTLNADSSSVWGYLRTSLICGGREDLLHAVDENNLGQLRQALPL